MIRLTTILLFFLLFLGGTSVLAQHAAPREIAYKFAQTNFQKMGLSAADVADLAVTDEFPTAHNGVTHVWLIQRYEGIPIYNALYQVAVKKDGSVVELPHRWATDLAHKVNSTQNAISVKKALELLLQNLEITVAATPRLKENPSFGKFIFEKEDLATWDILADLVLQPMKKGKPTLANDADELRLAWAFQFQQNGDLHFWHIRVDAVTGEILEKKDLASHDNFGKSESHSRESYLEKQVCEVEKADQATLKMNGATASYNVWALPTEAPHDGARVVANDPADATASPFGWHDTNGAAGAEFTTTRGNNTNAYQDDDGNNTAVTPSDAPNGTATLTFDSPFDPDVEPEDQSATGVINLFYMTNMMHDFAYNYGLDEAAGNFQSKNYTGSGAGNDFVIAEARDGEFAANPSLNNANFATPVDGQSGRMQMFVWDQSAAVGGNLVVNQPLQVAGTVTTSTANGWGKPISDIPVTGLVEIVDDGSQDPTFGCNPLLNDLTGKIALIDRQKCEFGKKVLNAQNAGAIGCIICNFENALLNMGAGAVGGQDTIPVVMIQKIDCDILRQFAVQGTLQVSLVQPTVTGPAKLDGDLDNGIIAHEFGHGISTRLVGGPNNSSCLGNAEEEGEGMGDLMSLFTTTRVSDTGPKPRGVGTYVQREDSETGKGIRRYPYSTDLAINPLTYADMATNTEVHAIGEIWTAVTWDFYWKMVDKYGFDSDLMHGTGGNNKAIQIFFDAMKLAPCSPGFLDMRDAFFTADEIDFGGIHKCLIWEAFARRGMGYDSEQGDPNSAADQVAGFEPLPTCIQELKIKKFINKELINPGDEVTFTLDVVNHKLTTVTNVVVTDELPDGLTYVAGSANNGGSYNSATHQMTWNLGTLASLDTKSLTYKALSANDLAHSSTQFYYDNMENGDANWEFLNPDPNSAILWTLQSTIANSGNNAWFAEESPTALDMTLSYIAPVKVTGAKPICRFWHQYITEQGADGGFVEISTNDGQNWKPLAKSAYLRRGPFGIAYGTFVLANLSAFSGDSGGWTDSYIDLSTYVGQDVRLRWRFGCDAQNTDTGWYMDDVEMMNLFQYDGQACITSNEGDNACAKANVAGGVYVNPKNSVATHDLLDASLGIQVRPNPASDMLYLSLAANNEAIGETAVSLVTADGRQLKTARFNFQNSTQILPIDIVDVPSGLYFVRFESAKGSGMTKVVVR